MNQISQFLSPRRTWLLAGILGLSLSVALNASDWPTFKGDVQRSGISSESLEFPLKEAWKFESAQPPAPAWSPPHFIILNRLDFDYAPQPVSAEGIVCFGSSADDTVRALDLETGAVLWSFPTGGPVRIAPQMAEGKVYFGSDDGWAYCLEAKSGKVIWKYQGAPASDFYIGNGRMISRWPIRTGVLVDQGVAYFVAGIWATEGVFAYAVDAETGKLLWCNDTGGYAGVNYNTLLTVENRHGLRHGVHDGDFGFYGLTPQGALAVTKDVLLIPNGYNSTAGMDRKTGKLLFAEPKAGRGGTWLYAEDDVFYTMYRHRNNKILMMKCEARTGERINFQHHGIHNLTTLPPRPGADYLRHEPGQTQILIRNGRPVSRNAFALIQAGEHLISGQDGYVVASDVESQQEVWRAKVDGKAYGLAVTREKLIVTTDQGTVYAFGSNLKPKNSPAPEQVAKPDFRSRPSLVKRLVETGMDRGYALVLGDTSGDVSLAMAEETKLHVIHLPPEGTNLKELRQKLVKSTELYGSRIHIPNASNGVHFADYFANAILLTEESPFPAGELFRMLRPCGGVLTYIEGGNGAFENVKIGLSEQIANGEVKVEKDYLVRGRLPGALDWDSEELIDRRVKWPLRPLWFGGPSTQQVTDNKNGNHRPIAAYGRYFVLGEDSLTAVDAYNGAILWTRPVPPRSPDLISSGGILYHTEKVWSKEIRDTHRRSVRVNDQHVYLHLHNGYFHGNGMGVMILDAKTGNQENVYAPYLEPQEIQLHSQMTWELQVDDEHYGILRLIPKGKEIEVQLQTTDPVLTDQDGWEIFIDSRPPEKRFGLYEEGVVRLNAKPKEKLRIPYPERGLGFAAILSSYDGKAEERIQRKFLFCDHTAGGLNNGWANIRLKGSPAGKPDLIVGTYEDLPKVRNVIAGFPKGIDPLIANQPRLHPLTLEPGPRIFRTGTGTCGGFDFSASSVIKRSGAAKVLGIYDFEEDSGLHTFVGVSAGCGPTTLTSQGLLIVSESKARCVCTFPFRTTLAMAPTSRRLQEDWAIFYDRDVDTRVRQASINLGASGDRRDEGEKLWLSYPRPVTQEEALGYPKLPGTKTEAYLSGVWPVARQAGMHVPIEVEFEEGGGPYRFNADRTPVSAKEHPWLYASGYKGIQKLKVKMDFLKPIMAEKVAQSPTLDGKLEEKEWPSPQAHLEQTQTDVFFTFDDENLYIAAHRKPPPLEGKSKRRGEVVWTGAKEGKDAEIWEDDSCEIFLTGGVSGKVLHLGGSVSGARYDNVNGDKSWDGAWEFKTSTGEQGLTFESRIPMQDLKKAGLDPSTLEVNFQINRDARMAEAIAFLGPKGRLRCSNFAPLGLGRKPEIKPRKLQVNLHFAEPENLKIGERKFDVWIQDQKVLNNFDLTAEAGSSHQAVVKGFSQITVSDHLEISFQAKAGHPIISAVEIREQN